MFSGKRAILVSLLVLLIGSIGCQFGPKIDPGVEVPEYKAILDVDPWIEPFRFDPSELEGKEKEVWETLDESIGILGWKQGEISAMSKDGIIRVNSSTRFRGSSSSAVGELVDVKSVPGNLLHAISKENLAVAYSIGNPAGYYKAVMKWLLDGQSLNQILRKTGGATAVIAWSAGGKMTLRGYREEIKRKLLPYVGDEVVFAYYVEEEEIPDESLTEFQPYSIPEEKSLIAISLNKKGLGEKLPEIIEDLFLLPTSIFSEEGSIGGGMPQFDIADDVEKIELDGYDIYTSSMAFLGELTWAEYKGILFFSDVETLKELPDLVNLPVEIGDEVDTYNLRFWFDLDITGPDLIDQVGFLNYLGPVNMSDSVDSLSASEEIQEYLDSGGKLGPLEFKVRNRGNGIDTELVMSKEAAPYVLMIHGSLMSGWEESMGDIRNEIDYVDRGNLFDWI